MYDLNLINYVHVVRQAVFIQILQPCDVEAAAASVSNLCQIGIPLLGVLGQR